MEPNHETLTLRHYGFGVGDWQTVSSWNEARHGQILPETVLPPLGVICEDSKGPAAALFAYQSVGIGVAHADHFLTRPGLSLSTARKAGAFALQGLCACLKRDNYGLLKVFTPCRALQRVLKNLGFSGDNGVLLLPI